MGNFIQIRILSVGVKLGVGILLAIVAHQVMIKKNTATSEFLIL